MEYNVFTLLSFERQTKRLIKKYPSLRQELLTLVDSLRLNPFQGTSLNNNCHKIRIPIASKGKGKSGGGRVITHTVIKDRSIYLILIYDKSEINSISDKEINDILKGIS
ncbi:type II toxin-antitoxin system RelE/ParE family toxin [Leptospira mtsangambouensis]|uniref:type II toxin-antitoxin system RelE/ParE family toxin n=1 Tax=Leptospira mtsangambouensis TaxID=2484912 RepID=UPI001EEA76FF|nr:type II toxin-antitoxin system RelE/ParE family toxin [Leptospira mtsangambouensis]